MAEENLLRLKDDDGHSQLITLRVVREGEGWGRSTRCYVGGVPVDQVRLEAFLKRALDVLTKSNSEEEF